MNEQSNDSTPVVKLSENGPYVVKNLANLSNSKGQAIPAKSVMALCRCGASGTQNRAPTPGGPGPEITRQRNFSATLKWGRGGRPILSTFK